MKILKDKKQLVLIAVILMLPVAFFAFRYLPARSEIAELEESKKAGQNLLNDAEIKNAVLKDLRAEVEKTEKQVAKFDQKIPAEKSLGSFLQIIAELMDENGLADQNVRPGDTFKTDNFYCIPLSIDCKGDIQQVFNFYRSLKQMPRVVTIDQIRLTNSKNHDGNLEMIAKVLIFYREDIS